MSNIKNKNYRLISVLVRLSESPKNNPQRNAVLVKAVASTSACLYNLLVSYFPFSFSTEPKDAPTVNATEYLLPNAVVKPILNPDDFTFLKSTFTPTEPPTLTNLATLLRKCAYATPFGINQSLFLSREINTYLTLEPVIVSTIESRVFNVKELLNNPIVFIPKPTPNLN